MSAFLEQFYFSFIAPLFQKVTKQILMRTFTFHLKITSSRPSTYIVFYHACWHLGFQTIGFFNNFKMSSKTRKKKLKKAAGPPGVPGGFPSTPVHLREGSGTPPGTHRELPGGSPSIPGPLRVPYGINFLGIFTISSTHIQ